MRWRLYPEYFSRPGRYVLSMGGHGIEIDVDAEGVFEFTGEQSVPLYAIAAPVGSKRESACLAIQVPGI